jgi:hypothetical protein
MSNNSQTGALEGRARSEDVWGTVLSGSGASLADALTQLGRISQGSRIWHHEKRNLVAVRMRVAPEDGQGYWELTRIHEDIYIVTTDYAYKHPRFESLAGDDRVRLSFNLSGDVALDVTVPLQASIAASRANSNEVARKKNTVLQPEARTLTWGKATAWTSARVIANPHARNLAAPINFTLPGCGFTVVAPDL